MLNFVWLQAGLMFIFAVSSDWLSVIWHRARENGESTLGALLAVLLGLIGWLSIYWVVKTSVWLILADLIGTYVGSYFGIKQDKTRRSLEKVIPKMLTVQVFSKAIAKDRI
jgi:hypothetical protein